MEIEARGEGPTAVMVHGLNVDGRVMIEAFDELLAGAGLRRLYVDLPGHGASKGDAARASADDFVDELAALVRAELKPAAAGELEAPIVIGYSYGGHPAHALVPQLGRAPRLLLRGPVLQPH